MQFIQTVLLLFQVAFALSIRMAADCAVIAVDTRALGGRRKRDSRNIAAIKVFCHPGQQTVKVVADTGELLLAGKVLLSCLRRLPALSWPKSAAARTRLYPVYPWPGRCFLRQSRVLPADKLPVPARHPGPGGIRWRGRIGPKIFNPGDLWIREKRPPVLHKGKKIQKHLAIKPVPDFSQGQIFCCRFCNPRPAGRCCRQAPLRLPCPPYR